MSIERMLQVCVATMAALGTLLFGIGQQSVTLPLLSALAAVTSLYVTDIRGWIRLNRGVANLAALLAVMIAIIDFFNFEHASQLLALANLLVYLQVILLFQPKDDRIYWQLLMLSLLQVMVATALNFGLLFGVLLVVYLMLALISLSLFLLLREAARISRHTSDFSADGPVSVGNVRKRASHNAAAFEAEYAQVETPSSDLLRTIGTSALSQASLTLGLTALLFFLVPRSEQRQLIATATTAQRMVGFSNSVELGELGRALQSDEDVMEVEFWDDHGRQLRVEGTPLFRGTVLNRYDSHLDSSTTSLALGRSRWQFDETLDESASGELLTREINLTPQNLVLQRTTLEPMREEKTVFHVYPVIEARNPNDIRFDPARQNLQRNSSRNRRKPFYLATGGFDRQEDRISQFDINPALQELSRQAERALIAMPGSRAGQEGDLFPELRAQAARLLEDFPDEPALDVADRAARSRALERYFLTDPRFSYSLEGQPRDRNLDPVEDFIAHRPRGHCEYYASALALMLRSQNIPARVVVGFKGGRRNSYGNYYRVKQQDAHSWVEVFLRPEQVPESEARPTMEQFGAWLRLDPTPSSDGPMDATIRFTMFDRARELMDYSQYLWSNYVVGLDAQRQGRVIYQPLANLASSARYSLSKEMWTETVPAFLKSLTEASTWQWLLESLLTIRGIAIAALILLVAYALWQGLRRLIPRIGRGRIQKNAANAPERRVYPVVEFYRQLESLLESHGLARAKSQTQHEFAVTAGGELRTRTALREVAALPKQLVDTFYRVRFGGHTLDKQQTEAVEQSLGQLATALASEKAAGRAKPSE